MLSSRIALLLMQGGSGVVPITYQLRDQFTTPDDAPLTSPRTCEPGPSTLVFTDTGNKLSIANGVLVKTGGTFKVLSGSAFSRANGTSFFSRVKMTTSAHDGIFGTSEDGTNVVDGINLRSDLLYIKSGGSDIYNAGTLNGILNSVHDLLVVQRSTGAYLFIRGGPFSKWHLLYPGISGSGASAKWIYKNVTATDTGTIDDAVVTQVAGIFSGDYDFAAYRSATPTSPISCTATPNALVEFTWTPASSEIMEIYLRQIDASNRIILRCDQTAGRVYLYRVTAGVETNLFNQAQIWTIGTPYRVVVECHMSKFNLFINNAFKVFATSIVNEFGTGYGASGFATGSNFVVYNKGVTNFPAPFDFVGWRWNYLYGDSKTMTGATAAYLSDGLEATTGNRWAFNMQGRSGQSVSGMASFVVNDMAAITESSESPENVLINLGTNDVASLPAEATWKANYRTIIETIHAKWSNAKIYLAKPVRLNAVPPSTPLAACPTMWGYIDGLAAEYDYVYVGMDETGLENGDGYVTYFADALHPNVAGYSISANLWKTILGY